jgi:divalent metal cation (Fe/Co/Zn/Cd) transporter
MAAGELPVAATAALPAPHGDEWLRLARRTRLLSWLSLAWLTVEGTVAIVAGIMAGSVALIAFGLDSAIEGVASVVIIWRFSGSRMLSDSAERRAQWLVAIQFFILAPFITFEAFEKLLGGGHVDTTWLGIGLTVATLAICQPLGCAKRSLGRRLASDATVGEGLQNLLCGYLAIAVLVGLLANTLFGVWWLDPLVALGIAGVALYEGRKALRGETCVCGACAVEPPPRWS